jgi:hypothetical protein
LGFRGVFLLMASAVVVTGGFLFGALDEPEEVAYRK